MPKRAPHLQPAAGGVAPASGSGAYLGKLNHDHTQLHMVLYLCEHLARKDGCARQDGGPLVAAAAAQMHSRARAHLAVRDA